MRGRWVGDKDVQACVPVGAAPPAAGGTLWAQACCAGCCTRQLHTAASGTSHARMYEDKFGTEDDPISVPSLEPERIIGVTDPEDDTLVVWGILKAGEPPRQFIENGEFYLLQMVEYVKKVGDVREELEASDKAKLPK